MADKNATVVAIDHVVKKGTEVIEGINIDLYDSIQPWLNKLYTGKYSEYFSINIFGTPLANFIAGVVILLIFIILQKILPPFFNKILHKLAKKTKTTIDDLIIDELRNPFRFLIIMIGVRIFFQLILKEVGIIEHLISAGMIIFVFWVFYAIVPAFRELLYHYSRGNEHLSYELSNFMIRMVRILIVFFGIIALLYSFGVNVTAFFASLGIGGLALALAAKDTAANMFGSIAILLDKSVRVGDWVKVDGIEGVVEDVGMRTTKIRTFEKSIVAIPNSTVATKAIENYSRRGIRRIKMEIGLTYSTTREQMEAVINDLRESIATHTEVAQKQTQIVHFQDFNPSDLGILIYCYVATTDWKSYLDIRQEINLAIMEVVNRHGTSFAFPSQSVYIEHMPEALKEKSQI
jgi:MscS family membrane protein